MNDQSFIPNLFEWDHIIVNSSGGKDSQTAIREVVRTAADQGFPRERITVSHQDLGKMEWPGTKEIAQAQAAHYGLRFEVSKYRSIDGEEKTLLQYVERRGKWPSSNTRFCTSEFKRGPGSRVITKIAKEVRERTGKKTVRVLQVFGFRSQESPARAKKPVFAPSKNIKRKTLIVFDWLPIHDWTEEKVWTDIRESGVPYHPAYSKGMPRLSCVFCIFAPKPALMIAGRENPGLLNQYVALEEKIDHSFQNGLKLSEIREAIKAGEVAGTMSGNWNM